MNNYEHEKRIRNWIAKEGISPKFLSDTDIETDFLIAQRGANKCLKCYLRHMEPDEIQTFIKFLRKLNSKKSRENLHIKAANKVMNLATKITRRAYRARKKFLRENKIAK
jgi:hypothetical protein